MHWVILVDLRLIDSCITQLKAQGPSRTCNESKEEEGTGPAQVAEALGDLGRFHRRRCPRRARGCVAWFRIWVCGLRFWVQGVGCGVQGLGFRV